MYDDDNEVLGFVPMIYDDLGRVHTFAFWGQESNRYDLFETEDLAQEAYENAGDFALSEHDEFVCRSCLLQKHRYVDEAG